MLEANIMYKSFESRHITTIEWYTPRFIFNALNMVFDLDPCSPGKNIVPWIPAKVHYTMQDNGLKRKWFGTVFLNPPYGRDTGKWLKRMTKHKRGIALLFSRTDNKWFHEYVSTADAICFIRKRISFIPSTKAILYAKNKWNIRKDTFIDIDGKSKRSQTGNGSMLVAWNKICVDALKQSNLGLITIIGNKS